MKLKSLALAAIASVVVTGAASAATIYASNVTYTPGTGITDPARMVTTNALGAPDGKFLSLGLGGMADFTFGQNFGSPGRIVEITFSRPGYMETANIFGSSDGLTFTQIDSVDNTSAGSMFTFAGMFSILRVVDTSPALKGRDGFDIDSVGVSAVPLPAAGLLLAGALAGLGVRGRRRKA